MSCIGAFAALTAEITPQNEAEAMKYAVGHYFSDSHSLDAGRAGTVRFADYTLEASAEFVIPEAYTGMFAPAEQSLVYGGYAQAFLENIAETPCASVGGWKMPILSFVCEVTVGDDEFIVLEDLSLFVHLHEHFLGLEVIIDSVLLTLSGFSRCNRYGCSE